MKTRSDSSQNESERVRTSQNRCSIAWVNTLKRRSDSSQNESERVRTSQNESEQTQHCVGQGMKAPFCPEKVWSWLEKALREEEQKSDTYAVFCRRLLHVAKRYPGAAELIGSMTKRIQTVLDAKGCMTKY